MMIHAVKFHVISYVSKQKVDVEIMLNTHIVLRYWTK